MAIDWGSTLGDAGEGAAAGTAILPGIGTAIGGGIGLLAGIFGGKKKVPNFQDPYAWQRDYAANQLLTSDIGAKAASAQAGQEMNFARDQAEEASNNPMLAGNASAQAGIRNKLLRGAESGAQRAYLGGAEVDSSNRAKGAQIAGESSRLAESQFELNQSYADRPTFGESFLQSGLSTLAGYGLSKVFGQKNDPSVDDTRNNIANTTVANSGIPNFAPSVSPPTNFQDIPFPPTTQGQIPEDGAPWDNFNGPTPDRSSGSPDFQDLYDTSFAQFNPFGR